MRTILVHLIPITSLRSAIQNYLNALLLFLLFLVGFGIPDLQAEEENASMFTISCIGDVQLSLPASGSVAILPEMVLAGNYPGVIFTVEIMGKVPATDIVDCSMIGKETMVSVIDMATGNRCMSRLHIEDKSKPIVICSDMTLSCSESITDDYKDFITVTDNCTIESQLEIWFTENYNDLGCGSDFTHTIERTWYAKDESGNVGSCTHTIFFERLDFDLLEFPDDITVYCQDLAQDPITGKPIAPDPEKTGQPTVDGQTNLLICDINIWSSDQYLPIGCSGGGKFQRTWNVMDWCTSVTRSEKQIIIIKDTLPPVLTIPADTTISTTTLDCFARYIIKPATATDVCSDDTKIALEVKVDSSYFSSFGAEIELGLGKHTLDYIAIDACGNRDTSTMNINVVDLQNPILYCHDIQVPLMENDTTKLYARMINFDYFDNCGISDTLIRRLDTTCNMPQDTVFGECITFCCADVVGFVRVEIKIIDIHGNEGVCEFNVDVKGNSTQKPEITCKDITVYLDANGSVTPDPYDALLTLSADCGSPRLVLEPNTFNCSDVGTVPANLIVFNDANLSDTCITMITVRDTIKPTALCKDITVNLDADGNARIDSNAVDNGSFAICGIDSMRINERDFGCNDIFSPIPVILTVVGINGLSDTCHANVTVRDITAPSCAAKDSLLVLDGSGMVSILASEIYIGSLDECPGVLTFSPISFSFDCSTTGDTLVEITVTDLSGNSSTCTSTLTIQDNNAPMCSARDTTLFLDAFGLAKVAARDIGNGSTDACGQILTFAPDTFYFDCSQIQDSLVTITVTDAGGLSSMCMATITIEDKIPPKCNIPNRTLNLELDDTGQLILTAEMVGLQVSDNCSISDTIFTPSIFDCSQVGVPDGIPTTIKIIDSSSNSATCNLKITLKDVTPPAIPMGVIPSDLTISCGSDISDLSVFGTFDTSLVNDACGISSITLSVFYDTNSNGDTVRILRQIVAVDVNEQSNIGGQTIEIICPVQLPVDLGGAIFLNDKALITPIPKVNLLLTSNTNIQTAVTDNDGKYLFQKIEAADDVKIIPTKIDEWLNGISVNDLVLLQKHILGISKISDPYQMIAADVDRSQVISVGDMVDLQRLILQVTSSIEGNSVWRFVDANYQFEPGVNPLHAQFPEEIRIDETIENRNDINFIGVKIGDLDGSAKIFKNTPLQSTTLDIRQVQDDDDEVLTYLISTDPGQSINSLQLGLDLPLNWEVMLLRSEDAEVIVEKNHKNDRLNLLAYRLNDKDKAIDLILKIKKPNASTNGIEWNLSNDYKSRAYTSFGQEMEIELNIIQAEIPIDSWAVSNIAPNPFSNSTMVELYSLNNANVEMRIMDQAGKLVKIIRQPVSKGINQYELTTSMFGNTGLYFIHFVQDDNHTVRKVLFMR